MRPGFLNQALLELPASFHNNRKTCYDFNLTLSVTFQIIADKDRNRFS